jgi:CO/xanthine dehydrogenase FAD-binding subunit
MDALPSFDLIRPRTLDELIRARAQHSGSSLLGGGPT